MRAYHEVLVGGPNDHLGDRPQPIDLQHPFALRDRPLHQPGVAGGDPLDRDQRVGIGPVARRKDQPTIAPIVRKDESQLLFPQGPEVVDEADPELSWG